MAHNNPKVSVIIQFLNSEKYLPQAIESVIRQTFQDWELVLVDGGSEDQSVEAARSYQKALPEKIKILEHKGEQTLGIFSSRIWGAKEAKAPILAHLDSDDEWHPQFLERHYAICQSVFGSSPGMVYCPVTYWWEDPALAAKSYVQPVPPPGLHEPPDLLLSFIEGGYQKSAANSGVMIARNIILEAESLIGTAEEKAGDDQFLWSFVILKYPVFISPEPLVRYRQWSGSTCAIAEKEDKISHFIQHHLEWLHTYLAESYQGNMRENLLRQVEQITELKITELKNPGCALTDHDESVQHNEPGMTSRTPGKNIQTVLKERLPANIYLITRDLYRSGREKAGYCIKIFQQVFSLMRAITARLRLGVGVRPFSYRWGYDRGLPVLRYYSEQFFHEFASDIQGHCLEFQEDSYTSRFGGARVTKLDILHQDGNNPKATLVADLTRPNDLPDEFFDCIICTFVLHVIFNFRKAVTELHRTLRPGGVLLVAVPHVSMCDPQSHELWRFTTQGLHMLLAEVFGKNNVTIRSYGNSLTTAGNIRGLAAHEFSKAELDSHDPRFASGICARAVKTR